MTTNDPGHQPGHDQPTVPFTPTDQQATAAYPPAYGAPQQPPAAPDTRPKTLGMIALITAVAGLLLVLAGFIPVLWVGLTFAIIGGLVLLVALVLGIATLVKRTQGGKGLGIGAIVVSVVGSAIWVGALTFSLVLIGLAAAGNSGSTEVIESPAPQVSVEGEDDATTEEETTEEGATTADEAAFVAAVRPQITALFQEIQPGMTEELLESVYSDEVLVATGQGFLMGGDTARQAFVSAAASGDAMTEEQAGRFVDILVVAAEEHLG